MSERRKKKGNGILFGLILMGAAIGAIWKNEHRFDYYRAASKAAPVETMEGLAHGTMFSHSGPMDQGLELKGRYVRTFQGYLSVDRRAEIYAWDRDEDDDGVSWTKQWMSYLQSNERNEGLTKKLKSGTIEPPSYQLGDLSVLSDDIQFADPRREIPPSELDLTGRGKRQGLFAQEEFYYLEKGDPEQLGDERLSYRGVPVPEVATYFGKWGDGVAVAHHTEVEKGFISSIIQDKGILHHLVAGPRETALNSIKEHLARLKKIVRIIGLIVCTVGGGILFSSLTRLLVFLPVVGPFINQVTGWVGMLIGFLLGGITLVLAYLTSRPIVLAALIALVVVALYIVWKNAVRRRRRIQEKVARELGHSPSPDELAELEFVQLWQLASSNGAVTPEEQRRLDHWTRRHGWSSAKITELTHRAERGSGMTSDQEKLERLIRYSLSDGRIDRKELKTLRNAAAWVGIDRAALRALMSRVQAV